MFTTAHHPHPTRGMDAAGNLVPIPWSSNPQENCADWMSPSTTSAVRTAGLHAHLHPASSQTIRLHIVSGTTDVNEMFFRFL